MSRLLFVLVIPFVGFCSCLKNERPNKHVLVAEDLCESLERYSVSIWRPGIDYQEVKTEYLSASTSEMSETAFFNQTKDFLLHFSDPHIWLNAPFEDMYSIDYLGYTKNINFTTIVHHYLENIQYHTSSIVSGTINDSIAYLCLFDFKGDNSELYHSIIDGFSDKSGLIIDVRDNNGGNVYNAQSVLNKLADEKKLWHSTQNRTTNGLDDPYWWYIEPEDEPFTKKVIVLTGRYTISAGERFVLGANTLSHVINIGDTTANTQGSVMGRELLNGWKYSFTFEKVLDANGASYEGIGISPDIYFQSNILDFSTSDPILEEALLQFQ